MMTAKHIFRRNGGGGVLDFSIFRISVSKTDLIEESPFLKEPTIENTSRHKF